MFLAGCGGGGVNSTLFTNPCANNQTTGCAAAASSSSGASISFFISNSVMVKKSAFGGLALPQQMSVTGVCNVADAPYNFITYGLATTGGTPVAQDIYGVSYVTNPSQLASLTNPGLCPNKTSDPTLSSGNCLRVGFCENGKFTLVITPPNDKDTLLSCNSCAGVTSQNAYQITVQLWTGTTLQSLSPGPYFTGNVTVQN
jgi:hypothetical protein